MSPRKPSSRFGSAEYLEAATLRRVRRRVGARGTLLLPALPSLLEHHVELLGSLFEALGRPCSETDLAGIRQLLGSQIDAVFRQSCHGDVRIEYETSPRSEGAVNFTVYPAPATMVDRYRAWLSLREPPLFGLHPDARLMELLPALGEPTQSPVLDVGAGTGRNALPLGRLGYPVDALELVPEMADTLRAEADRERLPVRVDAQDFFADDLVIAQRYRLVLLAEVASQFQSVTELRRMFRHAAQALLPGGYLLVNAFSPPDGYTPPRIARELSLVFWCTVFTAAEIREAVEGLPLELVSDEHAFNYEREHLPPGAFPSTTWFPQWSVGLDVYDVPPGRAPMALRWFVYRRG